MCKDVLSTSSFISLPNVDRPIFLSLFEVEGNACVLKVPCYYFGFNTLGFHKNSAILRTFSHQAKSGVKLKKDKKALKKQQESHLAGNQGHTAHWVINTRSCTGRGLANPILSWMCPPPPRQDQRQYFGQD